MSEQGEEKMKAIDKIIEIIGQEPSFEPDLRAVNE